MSANGGEALRDRYVHLLNRAVTHTLYLPLDLESADQYVGAGE